ncbi:hypothetical protein [Desulfopila inferna]|uniref:hypothetical protein n=1 Tax=Desulfopila inferna TaxID=468528 RepID=UPI0019629583|nr:hypothetical protein [Desulfopila inferna]MBM9604104.1 hypothetical protein [Desulfopila inferna]
MDYFKKFGNLFKNPWCPVFGISPGQGLPSYYQLAESGKIIDEARGVLKIGNRPSERIRSNYPATSQLINIIRRNSLTLSPEQVVMYRDIFREGRSIGQYAAEKDTGEALDGRPIHLFIEKTLDIAKGVCFRNLNCEMAKIYPKEFGYIYDTTEIPDYQILAILAIHAAYREAHGFVIYEQNTNLTKAYALLRAADSLLRAADSFAHNENINKIRYKLKLEKEKVLEFKPLVYTHHKQSQGLQKHNKKAKKLSSKRKAIFLKWYDQISAEKKYFKNSEIAKTIIKRMKNEEFLNEDLEIAKTVNEDGVPSFSHLQNIFSEHR